MVNMGELFAFDRIGSVEMERVQLNEREQADFALEPLDLLFARQSMVEAGAGKCSLITAVPELTCFESHIIRVRLDVDAADPVFYFYYFRSPIGRSRIDSIVTGAAQKGIRGTELAELPVHMPSREEQRAIASVLSVYDDLIASNERRMALLEESVHLLYRGWFQRLSFPGCDLKPIIDGLPTGWSLEPLRDAIEVTYGYTFSSAYFNADRRGLPLIRIRDVPAGESPTYTDEMGPPNKKVSDGDLLIGMDGEFHMSLWAGGEAWLNQRVCRLRSSRGLPPAFLLAQLAEPIRHLNSEITGTTVAHLGDKHLRALRVVVPDDALCCEVSERFGLLGAQIVTLRKQNRKLREARDYLLPRLMSGQLTV